MMKTAETWILVNIKAVSRCKSLENLNIPCSHIGITVFISSGISYGYKNTTLMGPSFLLLEIMRISLLKSPLKRT